jgi:hypothetical protein
MSWLALRDHRHGCPLDHLQTLRNIAGYAALLLRRQHKTPSIISEILWGKKFHPRKPPRTSSRKHASNVLDIAHRLTYRYNLTECCATCCMLPLLKCCHLPRNKTLAEYQSYNLGNLTIEYISCSPYRWRVGLLQKLVCISYRFNDTT